MLALIVRPVDVEVVDVTDVSVHVEQISVDSAHQGQGVCRALVVEVARWAAEEEITRECEAERPAG